jgi:hypothetical protein
VDARNEDERIARVDPRDQSPGEQLAHVYLTGRQGLVTVRTRGDLHILYI